MKKGLFLLLFICYPFMLVFTQPTVGLIQHLPGSTDDGYVLFAPMTSGQTFLIDKCGRNLHSWSSNYFPGLSTYFLPDGILLRTANTNNPIFSPGGRGGMIEKIDWNNNIVWHYQVSDSIFCQHHDVKQMPNGNILVIAWALKTNAEAIAAGSIPNILSGFLLSEKIMEIQPLGVDSAAIIWEWHAWDHLIQDFDSTLVNFGDIAAHPELIDLNYRATASEQVDLIHFNSVDYNPQFDQILVSSLYYNEVWIIDHSTTTAQAATHSGGNSGKGGDLIYRWGNPYVYGNGTLNDKKLFGQHSASWIEPGFPMAGDILVFNNGLGRPAGNYSTIDIIVPPVDVNGNYTLTIPYLPVNSIVKYIAPVPTDFFAKNLSGAQMLDNGNLLICEGQRGAFFEVDTLSNVVWRYINPVGPDGPIQQGSIPGNFQVFRCCFYPDNYSGFMSYNISPGDPLELNPLPNSCFLATGGSIIKNDDNVQIFPNPVSDYIYITSENETYASEMYDPSGRLVLTAKNQEVISVKDLPNGLYYISVRLTGKLPVRKKIIVSH